MLLSLKTLVDQRNTSLQCVSKLVRRASLNPSEPVKVTDESAPTKMTNAPGGPHPFSDHSLKTHQSCFSAPHYIRVCLQEV